MSDAGQGSVLERFAAVSDAALIGAVMLAIYLLYAGFGVALGLPFNGVVNTLQRLTFLTAVYAVVVLALNLHWGYTGLFNIGVAGFMMAGVYTFGMLTGSPDATATTGAPGLGLPIWVGLVGGMAAAGLVGAVAALPALRLKADYLAIVTIALAEIIRLTYLSTTFQEVAVGGIRVGTGGGSGISFPSPADPVREVVGPLAPDVVALLSSVGLAVQPPVVVGWAYTLAVVLVLAGVYWLMLRTGNSPFGRVLKAIREDELVAESLGKDTKRFKVTAFMVGCALMGLGGILWLGRPGFTTPSSFMPVLTFYVFIALIIGGAGSNTGSVLGGALFASLLFEGPVFVRRIVQSAFPELAGGAPATFVGALADPGAFVAYAVANVTTLRPVLLGAVLVYLMQNRPEGLLGYRKEVASTVDLADRRGGAGRGEADGSPTPGDDAASGGDRA